MFQATKVFQSTFNCDKNELYIGQISFLIFELIGICKPVTWNTRWKILLYNAYSAFSITAVLISIVSMLLYIIQNAQLLGNEMDTYFYFIGASNSFYKFISIFIQHQTVIQSKNMFMNKLCHPRDNLEFKILKRTSNFCR